MKQIKTGIMQTVGWFAIISLASCSGTGETPGYDITSVQRRNIETSIVATGIVKPKIGAEVKVGSRASGVVKKLYVKNGDKVRKGDVLAVLDDAELSAKYRLELANLDNAKTNLKYAAIELERIKALNSKDFASAQAYDNQVKEFDLAVARVASQQAMTDYAATQLGFTKIYAPISGFIGSVSTQEGETVAASFVSPTFVTIIDLARIEVWAYVDETDIGKVTTGQKVTFTVDTYPGTQFEGVVSAIYPKAEIRDNVVNYIAIVEIKNNLEFQLRPEMTTYVSIMTQQKENVLSVPDNAVQRDNNETVVYVLRDNHPEKRIIKTGAKGSQITEVLEGLHEHEQVILNSEVIDKSKIQ
jgi:RND family efflux transporter MFP subunit